MADASAATLVNPSLAAPHTATATNSPTSARTLPRPHCYTNAAPTRMEGNVFRYDFIEQTDCPPVNRKLKPKVVNPPPEMTHKTTVEDKPPEEFPAKPPVCVMEQLSSKLSATKLQSVAPPSVDRKCKPNVYKVIITSYYNCIPINYLNVCSWALQPQCRRQRVAHLGHHSQWYCLMKQMCTHQLLLAISTKHALCHASRTAHTLIAPAVNQCSINAPLRQQQP